MGRRDRKRIGGRHLTSIVRLKRRAMESPATNTETLVLRQAVAEMASAGWTAGIVIVRLAVTQARKLSQVVFPRNGSTTCNTGPS